MSRAKLLSGAAVAYVVLDMLHFGDHLRQGRSLAAQIYVVGNIGLVGAVIVAVLAVRGHVLAAPTATLFGFAAAVGVTATHLLPAWGFFSDSYTLLHLDAMSWVSAWSLVVSALALGLCGLVTWLTPGQDRVTA